MNVPDLVKAQRNFFNSHATRPLDFRLRQLRTLHDGIEAREAEFLAALMADLRKPEVESYLSEVGFVLGEIRHAIGELPRWMKPRREKIPPFAWPGRGWSQPEPLGVALVIGPWNYPLQLMLSPVVGAIAAGNCAVIKPSEFAPKTAAVIARVIAENFPPEYLSVVEGGRPVAEALLQEKFDHIFFTGSTAVGRIIMSAAAKNLTPVTLELGGKSPCIVCADAPLKMTARRIIWGKCLNAGQTCVAPDYLLVDQKIRDPLIAEMKRALVEFFGSDPQTSRDYSRIIHRGHFDRLVSYLGDGTVIHGGEHDVGDLFIAPTLLSQVRPDSPVMEDEIFGPILPILEFAQLDEALQFINQRPDPLALYVFSKDKATQRRVEMETRSGGLCINDTLVHLLCKNLPFGGRGESGMGAYHGRASFNCFTHHKSVVRRSLLIDSSFRYPPVKMKLGMLKRFFSFLMGG